MNAKSERQKSEEKLIEKLKEFKKKNVYFSINKYKSSWASQLLQCCMTAQPWGKKGYILVCV